MGTLKGAAESKKTNTLITGGKETLSLVIAEVKKDISKKAPPSPPPSLRQKRTENFKSWEHKHHPKNKPTPSQIGEGEGVRKVSLLTNSPLSG